MGCRGSTRGLYYPFVVVFTLSILLLLYGEIPSYPNEGVVRSFVLPYVTSLYNISTDRTSPFPIATTGRASRAMPRARKVVWQNLLNYRAHMHLSLSNDL